MLDVYINIDLYDKKDVSILLDVLRNQGIEVPVYIIEFPTSYFIKFNSDHHCYDIEVDLLKRFEEFEFTEQIVQNQEFKIQINRIQTPFSSDNWGRGLNTNAVETTKYLVKSTNEKKSVANQPFLSLQVLFEEELKEYKIDMLKGIKKDSNEEVFAIPIQKENETDDWKYVENKLFTDYNTAFWFGLDYIKPKIENDFSQYIKAKRKRNRKKRT